MECNGQNIVSFSCKTYSSSQSHFSGSHKSKMLLADTDDQHITLGPADVVCGRTALARSHGGNLKFRRLISKFGPVYQDAKSRKQKKNITMDIIKAIFHQGGRFLRATCESPLSEDPENLCLEVAPRDFIYEKVSHALRSFRPSLSSHQFRSCYLKACAPPCTGSGADSPIASVSLNSQGGCDVEGRGEGEKVAQLDVQLYQPIAFFPTPGCRRVSLEPLEDSVEPHSSLDWEPFELKCRTEEVRIDPAELQVLFEL